MKLIFRLRGLYFGNNPLKKYQAVFHPVEHEIRVFDDTVPIYGFYSYRLKKL